MVRIIKDDETDKILLKDQLEKKKTDTISIRLPADLMDKFKDYCTNEDIKPNALLKEMISNKVSNKFIYRGNCRPVAPIDIELPSDDNDYDIILDDVDLTNNRTLDPSYLDMPEYITDDAYNRQYDVLDKITLSFTNNKLDVWSNDGYKARIDDYEHEGLIIYEYDEYDELFIYLFNIMKTKKHGYYCRLVTIQQAIGLAEYVENIDLKKELYELRNDENKFDSLIENKLRR